MFSNSFITCVRARLIWLNFAQVTILPLAISTNLYVVKQDKQRNMHMTKLECCAITLSLIQLSPKTLSKDFPRRTINTIELVLVKTKRMFPISVDSHICKRLAVTRCSLESCSSLGVGGGEGVNGERRPDVGAEVDLGGGGAEVARRLGADDVLRRLANLGEVLVSRLPVSSTLTTEEFAEPEIKWADFGRFIICFGNSFLVSLKNEMCATQ